MEQRTAEYRISNRRMSKGGFASLGLFINFINQTAYIPSIFDIHYSIFDIRFLKFLLSIKPSLVLAGGCAEPRTLNL